MRDALILTVMGMGVVYLVLALIYGTIVGLGFMDRFWPQAAPASGDPKAAGSPDPSSARQLAEGPQPEEEAAIVAALARHMNRPPETFSVQIQPKK